MIYKNNPTGPSKNLAVYCAIYFVYPYVDQWLCSNNEFLFCICVVQVNKMSLEERHGSSSSNSSDDSSDGSFIIKSTDPRKPQLWFVCHAHSAESRSEWLQNLRQILQTQRDFLKAIQSPIAYQKELTTKEAS